MYNQKKYHPSSNTTMPMPTSTSATSTSRIWPSSTSTAYPHSSTNPNSSASLHHIDVHPSTSINNNAYNTMAAMHLHDDDTRNHNKITHTQTVIALFKGICGAGLLSAPYAFKQGGILGAILSIILLCILSSYTMKQLIRIKQQLFPHTDISTFTHTHGTGSGGGYDHEDIEVTYFTLSEAVLRKNAALLVYAAVVSCSLLVCVAYIEFILCLCCSIFHTSRLTIVLCLFPVLLILSAMKNYRYMATVSMIGNITITLSLVCVLYEGMNHNDLPPIQWLNHEDAMFIRWDTLIACLNIAAFLFATHFQVVSIESAMEKPSEFHKAVDTSFAISCFIVIVFGLSSYMMFGDDTTAIILHNIKSSTYFNIIEMLLCISIISSYGIVFNPGASIIENAILHIATSATAHHEIHRDVDGRHSYHFHDYYSDDPTHDRYATVVRFVTRVGLVSMTCICSLTVPSFGVVVQLVSGVSMASLAFIFPSLMALKLHDTSVELVEHKRRHALMGKSRASLALYGAASNDSDSDEATPSTTTRTTSTSTYGNTNQTHQDRHSNNNMKNAETHSHNGNDNEDDVSSESGSVATTSSSQSSSSSSSWNIAPPIRSPFYLTSWQRFISLSIATFGFAVITLTLAQNIFSIYDMVRYGERLCPC